MHCTRRPGGAVAKIAALAEKLIPDLQLGKLDRVEFQLADGRAILQPRADRLVFLRIAIPPLKA
jgi:hypothetical protein